MPRKPYLWSKADYTSADLTSFAMEGLMTKAGPGRIIIAIENPDMRFTNSEGYSCGGDGTWCVFIHSFTTHFTPLLSRLHSAVLPLTTTVSTTFTYLS